MIATGILFINSALVFSIFVTSFNKDFICFVFLKVLESAFVLCFLFVFSGGGGLDY